MKIAVTGATGLIGSALVPFLVSQGHEVSRLVRSQPEPGSADIYWNPAEGVIESDRLEGIDAVVHLAGENLARRWTAEQKSKIMDSRVKGTKMLAEALAGLPSRPKVLVSASAIGYYGDRGDELLTEESPAGSGFLADVCMAWESATEQAARSGIRVARARFGMVLSGHGGALARMLGPFRMGLGGRIGPGTQYMSWIAIDDLVRAILFVLTNDTLEGAINTTSPNPVTNAEFTSTLGRALSKPTPFPLPASLVRLIFGQMGEEVLLSSTRVLPAKLVATGFELQYPDLEGALRHVIQ